MLDAVGRDLDAVVRDLGRARARTLRLTDLDEPTLLAQHDPLMSPLVWDLAHVGQQEELWLLRGGDPARPGMLPPEVDSLYDAFKHKRADRQQLPLLPPVEARAYDYEVRGRVLDLLERTAAEDLFTAGMVVQHEEQHDETMYATLQLRQGPPVLMERRPLPAGRRVEPARAFVPGGQFTLGVDASTEPFSLDNERPAHTVEVTGFWIGRVPVSNRQWQEFIEDGGYDRHDLWSEPGWTHRTQALLERPLFWTQRWHEAAVRHRGRGAAGRAGAARVLLRGGGVRPLGRRQAPDRDRVGEGVRMGPGCASQARLAVGFRAAYRRAGEPRRRGAAAGADGGVPAGRFGVRGRADDRRCVGVDVVRFRPLARVHGNDLPRLQRAVLRRRL